MSIKLDSTLIIESLLQELGLKYEKEYKFDHNRKWAMDIAVPAVRLGIEIEGGVYGNVVVCNNCHQKVFRRLRDGRSVPVREGGRHNSATGFTGDCEKYNAAECLGWTVLRYTIDQIQKSPRQIFRDLEYVKGRGKKYE